jgi:hypothetical protein
MIADPGGSSPASVPNFSALIQQAQAKDAAGTANMADQGIIMQGSAGNLVGAAGTGFHITPEAAPAMIASVQESLHILNDMAADLARIQEAPQLGGLPAAQKVSGFTQSVATDNVQGYVQGILSLQGTLEQMLHAYQKAVANYHEIEQQVADSANQLQQAVQQNTLPPPQHGRIQAV